LPVQGHNIHRTFRPTSGGATPRRDWANALAKIPPPWHSKVVRIKLDQYILTVRADATNGLSISRFSMSGAHAHWVESLDTLSHSTKGQKYTANWFLTIKLRKTKNIEVHVTPGFTPLPQLSVINYPVPLAHFFPLAALPLSKNKKSVDGPIKKSRKPKVKFI